MAMLSICKPIKLLQKIFLVLLLLQFNQSYAQLKNNLTLQQLKDSIQSIVNRDHVPGMMIGLVTKDSVIYSGGFGYADVAGNRPASNNMLFRLGSITKMFIALSVLQLVQEGKLHLDDELKKVAPEVPFQNKWEATHPVRIVNLLEHTAGFDDMKLNRMCSQDKKEYSGAAMMLMQQPSMISRWKPGERHAYSNPGYVILGYIIEKISGKPYGQYIAENILQPLKMNHTNFNAFSKINEYDTKQYVVHSGKIIEVPSINCLMAPAGSLWSCANDMTKFLHLFLNNGKPIFSDSLIAEMETVHSTLASSAGLRSGYGLANEDMFLFKKSGWKGHTGLMGTCFSIFSYNRRLGVGFIMSSNGNQQNWQIESLLADYLEQHTITESLVTTTTDVKAIMPFTGQYLFENPRNEIGAFKDKLLNNVEVSVENNAVVITPLFGSTMKLVQVSPLQFAFEGANRATIIFTKNEEGKNVMNLNGAYYEQASFFKAKGKFYLAVLAVLFALSAALAGLISPIGFYTGKVKKDQLWLRQLPVIALALLTWAVMKTLEVQDESYLLSELTSINTRTIIIFAGTLLFAIFSVIHLIIVLRRFGKFKNKFFAVYWLLVSLSLCYISFVLFQNGWIGLRTWAM